MPNTLPQTRPAVQPAYLPQGTQWQPPSYAAQPAPTKVRGVMADVPAKFVLPSPDALGVRADLAAAPRTVIDWNQIQARMERLSVLQYQKERLPGGVQVRLVLPTSDPTRGQPVEARAETEAAAVAMALDAAEAWARKR